MTNTLSTTVTARGLLAGVTIIAAALVGASGSVDATGTGSPTVAVADFVVMSHDNASRGDGGVDVLVGYAGRDF